MTMCTGAPSAPPPPPRAAEAPQLPDASTSAGTGASGRRRRAAGTEATSTILTGSRGVQDGAATATKTLLGQ